MLKVGTARAVPWSVTVRMVHYVTQCQASANVDLAGSVRAVTSHIVSTCNLFTVFEL